MCSARQCVLYCVRVAFFLIEFLHREKLKEDNEKLKADKLFLLDANQNQVELSKRQLQALLDNKLLEVCEAVHSQNCGLFHFSEMWFCFVFSTFSAIFVLYFPQNTPAEAHVSIYT